MKKAGGRTVYRFGDFSLFPAERRLEQAGRVARIGARAFDILWLLVERAGEPVSKREIVERAWPDVTVGESSLRFQMFALRRMLDDDGEGDGSIVTLAGRGYCFVAPVTREDPIDVPESREGRSLVPVRLERMIGRTSEVSAVADMLLAHRFVTLVGFGGIGKTTVALAAAHELAGHFASRVHFIDLSTAATPGAAVAMVAHALGLPVNVEDPSLAIATMLRDQATLLILDSCEHVVDGMAAMTELVFATAPGGHILATSREALRAEGEHILLIEPLDYPAAKATISPAELLTFPAAQLLVERIAAAGAPITVDEETSPLIAEICREVDGIALALELTAGRIPSYGLRGTLALLADRHRFLAGGRRTAVPRHRTLADTLAWSYDLLDADARIAFRRLSVLVGDFDIEAAVAVAIDDGLSRSTAVEAVGSLASKSLLSIRNTGRDLFYRLLDTTRAYAFERLASHGEVEATSRRHAVHFAAVVARLDRNHAGGTIMPNLRAALEWCLAAEGEVATCLALAVGVCPLLLERSLLTECVRFSRAALNKMTDQDRRSQDAMVLNACLGQALMFTSGNVPEAETALNVALALAERFEDNARCLKLCGALHIFHERAGDYGRALSFGQRGQDIAEAIGDPETIAAGHSLLGIAHHLMGNHAAADRHLATVLDGEAGGSPFDTTGFGFDHRNRARITMARSHFLQGRPATAEIFMREAIAEAVQLEHPVTYAIALIWSGEIAIWREHWGVVEEFAESLEAHSERNALRPYPAVSMAARGVVAIHKGRPELGVRLLSAAIEITRAMRYELVNTVAGYNLADGLRRQGRFQEALAAIADVEASIVRQGDALHLPEVLRIKAVILAALDDTSEDVRAALARSLACAREQGAHFWSLRTAVTMAALADVTGEADEAVQAVREEYERYEEKIDSADLVSARALLRL